MWNDSFSSVSLIIKKDPGRDHPSSAISVVTVCRLRQRH